MPPKRDEIAESEKDKNPKPVQLADPDLEELTRALVEFLKDIKHFND